LRQMSPKPILFLFLLICSVTELAAQQDTIPTRTDTSAKDTSRPKVDTTRRVPRPVVRPRVTIRDTVSRDTARVSPADSLRGDSLGIVVAPPVFRDTTTFHSYFKHPHLAFGQPPVYMLMKERLPVSKDAVFYLLAGLLFFVAFTRLLFPKYFQNTFRLFFQTTFRQKQTREQLLQQNLGSLLMNLLFFLSGAFYLTLLLQHYSWNIFPFWKLLLYSGLALMVLYVGKFLFLNFAGWVFNAKEGAETYIFIVFLINKIIGVMLIPFILVIAFSEASLVQAAITASLILLALLFFYRYFVSLKSFRKDLHISPFHFFLYLCGVEIVPLLVIGKVVFNYIDGRF
jgi:hypothetical protein